MPRSEPGDPPITSKTIKFFYVLLLAVFPAVHAFSQVAEICNNGIDDDHDGFIDCYDGSCANSPSCDGLFLGNDASCQAIPPKFPKFTMAMDFSSPDQTTNHLARMVIGDYDRDGMPEIATMNRYTNTLYILRGNNGAVKYKKVVDFEPYWEIATANLDNDNCAELFFIGYLDEISHTEKINGKKVTIIDQYEGIYMFAYDCQLNFIWRTVEPFPDGNDPINYGVADFDGDGLVEIYAKDEIYDAKTGTRLIKSQAADYSKINGGPVAVNMLGDSRLELVLGLAIYDVDLTNRTLDNGKLTLLQGRNDYFIRYEYNATSVADYNLDGFLDVIASGSTIAYGKNTTVFFWDVKNNTIKTYSDPQPGLGSDYTNGWINGTGRLNIADLDGDGKMNVSYVSGRFLYALNENFGLFWKAQINEETSGYTGCTLFDFNGDGKAEIVYRDERYLYIINGTDGTNYQNPQTCISRTNREYPIVADVDADGSTEICVTCGFNDANAAANFNTLSYSKYSHVRVFKSAAEPWVPARRIWNQHGYFIVNVNDDLTIPKVMQAHHLVWSTGSCTTGPNRPLNKFLNQSPFLNSKGCPTYAAVNLTFSSIKPKITPPQCPSTNFTVSLQLTNLGDVSLTGTVPISFYTSNPKRAGATKLTTINVTLTDLKTNQTFDVNNLAINGNGSDSLYLVLNDAGTTVPTPISLPNGTFFECDYTDNVYGAGLVPLPVTLSALPVNPNNACINPANGAARAFVPIAGGGENTVDYNFYWFNGTVAKPIASANFVGPIYSGIPDGTYTVFARHKTAGCNSDTVQVVVGVVPGVPAVNITVVSDQTSCVPPNGQLSALVTGGNTGFTFTWFDISLTPLGITGPVANGLVAGTYVVFASRNGCNKSSPPATIAGPLIPDAAGTVLTNVTDCSNPNSGSIKADALVGGVVQNPANYTFDWYFYNNATSTRGSILPPANGTGQTRTGLAAGYYQALVKENTSQCVSAITPIVQVLNQTVLPTAAINQVAPQTSCDPANPNGILSGDALIGGIVQNPATFTFEWFKGDNTLPANLHTFTSGTNGQVANKVAGGGVYYTVRVTSANHCSATNKFIITENINNPVVTLAATNNSICDPVIAGTSYNGAVSATVTFAGAPVSTFTNYKFTWHNGQLITDPVISVGNNQLPTLPSLNGGYYTVEVQRTDLGCNAVPKTVQVLNVPVVPVIVTNNTPATNCTGAPNGILDAKVDLGGGVTTTTGYTFKWFKGNNIAAPLVGATPNVTGQPGGQNYTVQVINTSSGCTNTLTVALPDASALPVITLTPAPNSVCNPALTSPAVNFNGSVTAAATYKGAAVGSFAGYTFTWHNGSLVTDPVNGSSTNQNLTAVNGGFYTVTASIVALGCTSSAVTSQVLNAQVIPVITTTTVASTNCDPLLKNGQASVTNVDGVGTGAPYTFKWYDGVSVAPGSEKALTALYNNVQGGAGQNYTVLVTNQTSGCQNNKTVQVSDAKALPVVTLSKTDNTRCIVPKDGSATINTLTYKAVPVSSPYAGYTFSWNTGATTSTLGNVGAGSYTLSVTNTSVGCTSSPVSVTVNDNLFTPVINVTKAAQTSCDVANPNGILTATINETTIGGGASVTAGYGFVWHKGTQVTDPTVTTTTGVPGQVNQLKGNLDYMLEATRTSSGCKNTSSVFLPETVVLPAVAFTTVTPLTRCDTRDASILTTVTQIPVQTYTYFWMKEPTSATTTDPNTVITTVNGSPAFPNKKITGPAGGNTDTFGNLIPGEYTIVVVDNYTTCVSQPVSGTIVDNSLKSVISITLGPIFPSACGTSDGQMSATIAGGVGPYDLLWHKTGPVNSNINFFTNPPQFTPPDDVPFQTNSSVTNATANNLAAGVFTLVIKDVGNGCGNYETVTLPFTAAHTITPTLTPSTICPTTSGNGNIKVTLGNVAGGKTFQDYTYVLYAGENPDPAKQVGAVIGSGGAVTSPQNFPTALQAGMYTIEVRQAFSGNCPAYEVVEILQNALNPVVTLVGGLQANTACDLLQADGKVVIDIEKDPADIIVAPTYTLDISPPPLVGPSHIVGLGTGNQNIAGLKPSGSEPQYTITVTSSNNCVTQRFISIPDQPAVAQLQSTNITVTDAPLCSPSGSVEVTSIAIVGAGADNLNNFRFDWFSNIGLTTNVFSAQGDNTATKGGEFLDNTTFASIGPGSFWVTATKNVAGQPGFGCTSSPFKSDIADVSVHPVITLNAVTNTACDNNYEGKITVQVNDPGGLGAGKPYTYVWDPTNPIAIPTTLTNNGNGINDGDGDNPTNLKEGTYAVTATNNFTSCTVSGQISILKSATPILVANATAADKQLCAPDGSITIGANDVTVNGVADPVHTNFVFDWFLNSPTGPVVLTGAAADVINNATYPAIAAGDYYVIASRAAGVASGSGCQSAPLKKSINDLTINPVVSFNTIANTACDNNFDAKITVLSSTASGLGSASNYDIAWTTVPAGSTVNNATNVGGSYATTAPDVVGPGSFSVLVTNRVTQCATTGSVSILSNPQPVDILTVNKTDQAICNPDGSISVASLNSGGVANYTYNWFRTDPSTPPLVDGGGATIITPTLSVANYPTIGAGTYFVVATKTGGTPGSGCKTPPFRKDVLDNHKDPKIQFSFTPNSSCDNVNPNGTVLANAAEQSGANTDTYSFAWTLNGAALPGVTTQTNTNNSSQLAKSFEGTYKLTILNVTTTGCQSTSSLNVDLNLNISLPNVIGVSQVDPTDCSPNGSAQVTSVAINGGPPVSGAALATSFTYAWYANNFTPANILPTTTPNIVGLGPISYFVLVQDNSTKCQSGPREVKILDTNIAYPVVTITQTAKQISCIATTGTAALSADAAEPNGSVGAYSFTWYSSLNLSGPVISGPSATNPNAINNLVVGNYSVEVQNTATGCKASALYIVPDDVPTFKPNLALSSQPHTLCTTQDGFVVAKVVGIDPAYPFPLSYTADLYFGSNPNLGGPPDVPAMGNIPGFTTSFVASALPDGPYTVRVTDNNTSCTAVSKVSILDERKYPTPVVSNITPNANCDPANANGKADVLVNGTFVGYQFDWYEGGSVTGAPVYTGAEFSKLKTKQYTIQAIDRVTGCTGTVKTTIPDQSLPIPAADILKLSDVTSCITNNGSLTASVGADKNTKDYIFNWYDGNRETATPDFVGEIYSDLAAGDYSVTATSRITGCKSPLKSQDVIKAPLYPDFTFVVQSPSCDKNNGFATLVMISNVPVERIEWDDSNGPFEVGPNLEDVKAGSYTVTVTSDLGCATTKDVEILPEVRPFNGISRNHDGQNDFFQIDCIQDFPNNIVKIYNRAGTLVFEAIGYDNTTVYFDGQSNRGVSIMGTHLPDGTYFYIVDKRNGTKPLAGYLELVD